MVEALHIRTVAATVAGNVRAFRHLRGIDQATLARRMESLGIAWRQVTVSDVERGPRNVTVAELLALAATLGTTIEQLLDPRGPERIRGPLLSFSDPDPDDPSHGVLGAVPPEHVTGLVCTHADRAVIEWEDDGTMKSLWFEGAEPR
jgi:transcriptional regulator with XRE-family HTH domain